MQEVKGAGSGVRAKRPDYVTHLFIYFCLDKKFTSYKIQKVQRGLSEVFHPPIPAPHQPIPRRPAFPVASACKFPVFFSSPANPELPISYSSLHFFPELVLESISCWHIRSFLVF